MRCQKVSIDDRQKDFRAAKIIFRLLTVVSWYIFGLALGVARLYPGYPYKLAFLAITACMAAAILCVSIVITKVERRIYTVFVFEKFIIAARTDFWGEFSRFFNGVGCNVFLDGTEQFTYNENTQQLTMSGTGMKIRLKIKKGKSMSVKYLSDDMEPVTFTVHEPKRERVLAMEQDGGIHICRQYEPDGFQS